MVGKKNQSALLAKYYNQYKKNPRGRVFAPLAEAFRKLGMLDDAFKVLKEGIRHHPNYTLGYIVLAHCYYDQEKYELTYNTLRPIIAQNADNISLQKIFAQACIHLGYLEEALDTFKYLLFMNPKDRYFAEQVKRLEDDLMVGHKKLSLDQIIKAPEMPKIESHPEASDDDWVQVDFNKTKSDAPKILPSDLPDSENSDEDAWVMKKPGFDEHPILKNEEIIERDLDDEFYADEFEEDYGDIEEVNASSIQSDAPIISHTLIDLYCAQRYFDKAIELLEKILELNPGDKASMDKLKSVKAMQAQSGEAAPAEATEQDGHDELISIIENQVKAKSPKEIKVEHAFNNFLDALKEKAQDQRSV